MKETQNSILSHIIDDYKIAGALINVFFSERISDREEQKEMADEMKSKLKLKNSLEKFLDLELPK